MPNRIHIQIDNIHAYYEENLIFISEEYQGKRI